MVSQWDRLPLEVEHYIWKLYFQMHVLPGIRRYPSHRGLKRLLRSLGGSISRRSYDPLTIWTELIACHWITLEETRENLEYAFPKSTTFREYDDGTSKLFWMHGEHTFSVMKDSLRYYLSYHGSLTSETAIVDVRTNEIYNHSRLVNSGMTIQPRVRSWNRRRYNQVSSTSVLSGA